MLISQEIHDDIVKGFTLGNSELISPHTAEIVELILPDYEGSLSKDMTNKKLNAFFIESKISSFEVVHKGSTSAESNYIIGELVNENGKFSVYALYAGNDIKRITEIRIESDE